MKLKLTTHTQFNVECQFKQYGPLKEKVGYDKLYKIA